MLREGGAPSTRRRPYCLLDRPLSRTMTAGRNRPGPSTSPFLQPAGIAEVGILEQLVERPHLADHALLMGVALDGHERLAIDRREPIGPRVAPQDVLLLLDCGPHPGERH